MKKLLRNLSLSLLTLASATILPGCSDNGGNNAVRVFFGINGSGNCDSVVVEVDLEAAEAVLARDVGGDLQCDINAILDAAGCDIDFESDGDTLIVTITGCSIPGVAGLFDCVFEHVDISDINFVSDAECDCDSLPCDTTPPVCASSGADPTSCEDCNNGDDDDDDGLTDCDDPQCDNDPACTGTSTTTTTSSTDSITTSSTEGETTTTSTTETTGDTIPEPFCTIVFALEDAVEVGSLQFDVDYAATQGALTGNGPNVECATLIDGAIASFNDNEAQKKLSAGIIALDGFTGPINIAECSFQGPVKPTVGNFDITVVDASDPNVEPIEPTPDVVVSAISCGDDETTTTLGNPTTTLGVTTTTEVSTSTQPPDSVYNVTFQLATASDEVGALQFSVDYETAPGDFSGTAADVECENQVNGAIFAPNDDDANNELALGYVSLNGFSAPTPLAVCEFEIFGAQPPVPEDFVLTIEDASDPNFEAITVDIDVLIAVKP